MCRRPLQLVFLLVFLPSLAVESSALPFGPCVPQRLEVETVSVHPGESWKLNRPIDVCFNGDVDFSTVNPNTLSIRTRSWVPAVGEYSLPEPRRVRFRPACPTKEDLSDTGLRAGDVYVLHLPSAVGGTPTVRSSSGMPLSLGATVTFRTPSSAALDELFYDEVPGPPRILVQPGDSDGSWVWAGDGTKTWFQLGSGGIATLPDYLLPLNLYSEGSTRVVVDLRFDQSLLPTSSNLDGSRVRLEVREPDGSWSPLATRVSLVENCAEHGSTLELVPQGVLPQRRLLRVWVGGGLQDLVGESNGAPLDFLRLRTGTLEDDEGAPLELADEWFEAFELGGGGDGSLEDTEALEPCPRADWGEGALRASTGFVGTGGVFGEFDLKIRSGTVVVFDTTSTLFIGGPNFSPQYTQLAVNGVLQVRRLWIEAGGVLRCQGPNPVTIHATGTVTIDGELVVDGSDATAVFTLDTPFQPEPGAFGQCGGGTGGVGSYLTTQVTPRGGNGNGAYQSPNRGGQGGEAGWHPSGSNAGIYRRAAGGGGGRFGQDQRNASGCLDQTLN